MAVNKVVYGNNTIIDLTGDTVTAADLPSGVTAHDRSGVQITGSASYQPTITVSGILKGDGNGGVTAATAGTDYIATNPVYIATATSSAAPASSPTITMGKTYAQIKAAYDAGHSVFLDVAYSTSHYLMDLVFASSSMLRFTGIIGAAAAIWSIALSSSDVVTATYSPALSDASGVSF